MSHQDERPIADLRAPATPPLCWGQADREAAVSLLARFGIGVQEYPRGSAIPGSYWGEPEAGLLGDRLFLRPDTPLHSVLHEACHSICMDETRRAALDTDAGGDHAEEDAVCYLQILLADELPGFGRTRMMADMDTWGYSFRLGSARAWFEQDAEEARDWLVGYGIIDPADRPTWSVRRG